MVIITVAKEEVRRCSIKREKSSLLRSKTYYVNVMTHIVVYCVLALRKLIYNFCDELYD